MKTLQSCLQAPDKDQRHHYCHRHLVGCSSINGNTFGQLQSPQALTPQENLSSPVWVKNYGFSWCYDSEGGYHWDGDGDGDYQGDILYLPCSFTKEAIAVGWMGCWLPCANTKQYLRLLSDSFYWLTLFEIILRPVISTQAVVGPLGTGKGQY